MTLESTSRLTVEILQLRAESGDWQHPSLSTPRMISGLSSLMIAVLVFPTSNQKLLQGGERLPLLEGIELEPIAVQGLL